MLLKYCTQYASKFGKLNSGHKTRKCQFSFQFQRKEGNAKECSNYCTVVLISHVIKTMFKIIQAGFQQFMNQEHPYVQACFRKGRETRHQTVNIHWIIEKAREMQKNICFIDYAKAFDCVDHTNCGKFSKR